MALDNINTSSVHTLLSAATSVGAGTSWSPSLTAYDSSGGINVNQVLTDLSVQVVASGAPVTTLIHIEASLDGGTTWVKYGDSLEGVGLFEVYGPGSLSFRANLIALDGGTSPSVSVYVLGVK